MRTAADHQTLLCPLISKSEQCFQTLSIPFSQSPSQPICQLYFQLAQFSIKFQIIPPNTSAHGHERAMPLLSQNTANLFQVQTVAGVLPLPIERTRNAWNAVANTSRPVVPTANVLSGPGNGSRNFTLLFSTRGDFVRLVRPPVLPPVHVAVPPRHYDSPRQALLRTGSSFRTAPYPTGGIMTAERQVRWNPLPVCADYQGMRNELPYTRPPAVQVARPQNRYRLMRLLFLLGVTLRAM